MTANGSHGSPWAESVRASLLPLQLYWIARCSCRRVRAVVGRRSSQGQGGGHYAQYQSLEISHSLLGLWQTLAFSLQIDGRPDKLGLTGGT